MPLEEQMGVGALGVTWRSRLPDGTAVALKRLAAPSREPDPRLEQLQRLGDLGHGNLLGLLSVFQEDGHVWVASRLNDGVSLNRVLEGGRMRPACAVAIGMAVLDGLTALHAVGI